MVWFTRQYAGPPGTGWANSIQQVAMYVLAELARIYLVGSQQGLYIDADGAVQCNTNFVYSQTFTEIRRAYDREMAEYISEQISIEQATGNIEAAVRAELTEQDTDSEVSGGIGERAGGRFIGTPTPGGGGGGGGAGGAGGPGGPGPAPTGTAPGGAGIPGRIPRVSQFEPGGPGLAVAAASQRVSGPLEVGAREDKHRIGTDRDNHPINSLHLSELTYFFRNQVYDGPIEFGGAYILPKKAPYNVFAYLEYDAIASHPFVDGRRPGLWKFRAECNLYSPDGGGYDTIPKDLPFDQHGSRAAHGWGPGDGHDHYVATNQILGSPGLVFRPQPLGPSYQDLRNSSSIYPAHLQQHDYYAPVSVRAESYAAAYGDSHVYTQAPSVSARYVGGTADGGLVFMSPEVDMADAALDFVPDARALSTVHILAVPGQAYWGAGYPKLDDGTIRGGYRWGADTAGVLLWEQVDTDGTLTDAMQLTAAGELGLFDKNIIDVADPVDPQDAATKAYVDGLVRSFSGSKGPHWVDHFVSGVNGETGWVQDNSGAGSAHTVGANAAVDGNHSGWVTFETGTATTGRARLHKGGRQIRLGGGAVKIEAMIRIEDLSTAGEEYDIKIGLTSSLLPVNAVYFLYDRNTNSDWQAITLDNSTPTTTDTNVAVAADSNIKLKIEINAAGSEVKFYINGSLVATHTTNIPTASGREVGPDMNIVKSAGTTSRLMYVDYYGLDHQYTTEA